MICSGIDNSTQLLEATKAMKGLILDRFLLFDSFRTHLEPADENQTNELDLQISEGERLPSRWLSSLRIKELEIQHSTLSSCFLCDEPFAGQSDFLVSLSVAYSSLDGHLCNTCNTRTKSTSLRELTKTPRLKYLDLSHNVIEVIDGLAFPLGLVELTTIKLANNKINKIHDNAFSTLNRLTDLDLSKNELTAITRKIFRPGSSLQNLDLSWNSLQALPDRLFDDLRNLKELKISYNLIEVLPSSTWMRVPVNIEKLDFTGNFLVCNCTMSWITGLLGKSTKVNGKCVYPAEVESQELKASLTSFRTCS